MIQDLKGKTVSREVSLQTPESNLQATPNVESQQADTWFLPAIDLLDKALPYAPGHGSADEDIAARIAQQFAKRGIDAEFQEAIHATRMTTYKYRVRDENFSQIVKPDDSLRQMISMAIEVSGVSIQAPLPNSAVIAVHVPEDSSSRNVQLSGFISKARMPSVRIPLILGEDYLGRPTVLDLAQECHQLVAGQTGSGKSVFLRSQIMTIVMSCSPHDARLILVDGKGLDLTPFEGLPHCIFPVITDRIQALAALRWMNEELRRRRQLIRSRRVRDLWAYTDLQDSSQTKDSNPCPAIIMIVDEFQTLVSRQKDDETVQLLRILAQQGRACGLFLILATQRPSVDILQGSIKTNIPGRVCFALPSQVDSRVVLDRGGAELLARPGDLLAVERSLGRIGRYQVPYTTDEEVARICGSLKSVPQEYLESLCDATDVRSSLAVPTESSTSRADESCPAPTLQEHFVRPTTFAPVLVAQETLLRKLNRAYPDRSWRLDLTYMPFLLGVLDGHSLRQVLYCPSSKELILRLIPWTTLQVGPLLEEDNRLLGILQKIRSLPHRMDKHTDTCAWLAKQGMSAANVDALISFGYVDANLRLARPVQCPPILARNLQAKLLPDNPNTVQCIDADTYRGSELHLRKLLGLLWGESTKKIAHIGLPTYRATTSAGESLTLVAAHQLPWLVRLQVLSVSYSNTLP